MVILCLILGLSLHLADVVILGSGLGFGDRFAEVLVFCPHPCLNNIFAHILLDGVTHGVIPGTMSMSIMVITGMYSLITVAPSGPYGPLLARAGYQEKNAKF